MAPKHQGFRLKIDVLMQRWACPKLQPFLRSPPLYPLPKAGPISELLTAAKQILDKQPVEMLRSLAGTHNWRIVGVLAKILCWLQQRPCCELHSASDMDQLPWYHVAKNLTTILATIAKGNNSGDLVMCLKQLENAEGKL